MDIKVSVVVPVYNSEKYLVQCADSLVNQTLKEIELIFVDDGSSDRSVELLEEYRKKDSRITVLHQQNMHAGMARNNGMKHATGKYLMFLDSDDYFEPNMLEELYQTAESKKTEIVFLGAAKFDDETSKIIEYYCYPGVSQKLFAPQERGKDIFSSSWNVPWDKFYLRSFLVHIGVEFQDIVKNNDVYFAMTSVALAQRAYVLKKYFVHYRSNNPDSLQGKNRGTEDPTVVCHLLAYERVKKELRARQIWGGEIEKGISNIIEDYIETCFLDISDEGTVAILYCHLKEHLVPDLFDSPEKIAENGAAAFVLSSGSLVDFLLKYNQHKIRSILGSRTFRAGHRLLAVPRWIRRKLT